MKQQAHNPYAPPTSDLDIKEVRGPRPFGIKLLAALFLLFSAATTFAAYLEDEFGEWLLVLGSSLVLVIILRGIVVGREKGRRVGVFLGFFIGLLNSWAIYDASTTGWRAQDLLYAAEGVYAVVGALYLVKLKGIPFFR